MGAAGLEPEREAYETPALPVELHPREIMKQLVNLSLGRITDSLRPNFQEPKFPGLTIDVSAKRQFDGRVPGLG